jgi:hypothetical protein
MFESGDDFDLGATMSAMGVTPLAKSSGKTIKRDRTAKPPFSKPRPSTVKMERSTGHVESLHLLSTKNAALQIELAETTQKLREVESAYSQLMLNKDALAEALLELHQGDGDVETVDENDSLQGIFKGRGLSGRGEFTGLLTTLIKSQRLFDIFPELNSTNPRSVRHLLSSRVFLHCGDDNCVVYGPVLTVLVAPDRCELCGGNRDSVAPLGQMSESLMLQGFTKVAVVTSRLAPAKVLRAGLHQRITLTILPVGVSADLFAKQQLVVDWGEHAPSKGATDNDTVILRCKSSGIAELSKRVCSYMQKLDK